MREKKRKREGGKRREDEWTSKGRRVEEKW